jgi:hypothetical protein
VEEETRPSVKTMTFRECIELAACPYCRRQKGDWCFVGGKGYLAYPHKSRSLAAYNVKWGNSEPAALKATRAKDEV